jgi:hypothetical protein
VTYTPSIEPDPREEKLPRWARELLSNARMRVRTAEANAEAALLATKPDETDTVVYRYGSPNVGLEEGSAVQFRLGPHYQDYVQCRIERDKHYGARVNLHGGRSIRIEPGSSNTAHIGLRND